MKSLPNWNDRSMVVKMTFNPILLLDFTKYIIHLYHKEYDICPNFYVPFLAIPFFIFDDFRSSLPYSNTTLLTSWILGTEDKEYGSRLHIFYQNRYNTIKPYIQEAIILGVSNKEIEILNNGKISLLGKYTKDKEFKELYETKIKIVNKWFSPTIVNENIIQIGVIL